MRLALVLSACLACAACARPIERGEALYRDGRYVEAAEMFELTEPRLATLPPDARAAFGLYRGLTYLHLDDIANARKWLGYAHAVEQKSPGILLPEQRRLLQRGWAQLDRTAPAPPPEGPRVEQKIAATVAPAVAAPPAEAPPPAGAPSGASRSGVQ